jgi:NAD(P)-dependent dehydrogenase (short-subunit alcohol dehydrogenase family)
VTHSVVIGGTRGLGREIVRQFSEAGHIVSVIGRREPLPADKNLAGVNFFVCDLTVASTLKSTLAAIVSAAGPVSYLVFSQRYRGKDDAWQGEMDVTVNATKMVIDTLSEGFATEGDRAVVFISSSFGDSIGEGQPVGYHVGKAALNHMMRFYAVNLGRKGIRVNAVTPMTFLKDESKDFYLANPKITGLYERMIPLGRMGSSTDCSKVVSFLCSANAGFVNGQNIYVDGGLSLVWPESLGRSLTGI